MSRDLNPLQRALVDYVKSIQSDHDQTTREEIERVRKAISESGRWQEHDEWRISTYFDSSIEQIEVAGTAWFKVRVECDTQEFICRCPTIEKAVLFSRFYRRLVVDQFYSVGPPWA